MTNEQLKNFIAANAELITARINEYTAACNIKLSEFSDAQRNRLIANLAAIEIAKIV